MLETKACAATDVSFFGGKAKAVVAVVAGESTARYGRTLSALSARSERPFSYSVLPCAARRVSKTPHTLRPTTFMLDL